MTTFTQFVTALGDLAVTIDAYTTVTKLNEPPTSLENQVMPVQWVQLPTSEEGPMTFQAGGMWPNYRAQLVMAINPVAQSTQAENWSDTLTALDAIRVALTAAVGTIAKGPLSWALHPGVVTVAGTDYWAVIAEVSGNG